MSSISNRLPFVLSFISLSLLAFCATEDPVRPYPLPDDYLSTTSILDHPSYVSGFDDAQWYLDNIPFVDFPDKFIQRLFYYRTTVVKRHLKYGHEGQGWLFTEFIHPVAWASKLQTIPDSAAYHVIESRWLRNPNYAKDLVSLYMRGGIETLGGISYTHWMQTAVLEHAQVTGDKTFLLSQLDGMIQTYRLWNVQKDSTTGLYHRTPLSDAQEYSLPGYLTGGPGGGPVTDWQAFDNDYQTIWLGPETYRPNFNAYMVAGARTISQVAALAGNSSLAEEWTAIADDLYERMVNTLYSPELNFWTDVVQGSNLRALGRELIGFFPYRFGVGTNDTFVKGLEASLDPEHFLTEFGPTTLERTNEYYTALKNTTYCCIWQGQSWPFSTGLYLDTLAMLARENRSSIATSEFFFEALTNYTKTNYKDGIPYTAESHYPELDMWSGDTSNHSEHYLHSTYLNNIFTSLIGIIPTLDDRLELRPLVPSAWSYFAVENLPYHGALMSILWDLDGTHYQNLNHSSGLSIFSNGRLIYNQASLSPVNITLPSTNGTSNSSITRLSSAQTYSNILSNPNAPHGLPNVTADWTLSTNGDYSPYEAWKMIDGLLWYDTTPDNRWTNNQSTMPFNTFNVTLPRPRQFASVSLAIYADTERGGVIACPAGLLVTTRDGTTLAARNPWTGCVPNSLNTILFDDPTVDPSNITTPATGAVVETDFLSVTLTNKIHYAVAVPEVQIWVPSTPGPRYEVEDGLLGTFIGGFEGRASGMNCTIRDGGVQIHQGGWAEVAGVKSPSGHAQSGTLTLVGGGTGTVDVMVNWLEGSNTTVSWSGSDANQTIEVEWLEGGNYVTLFQTSGTPWVDAVVVS